MSKNTRLWPTKLSSHRTATALKQKERQLGLKPGDRNGLSYGLENICKVIISLGVGRNEDKKHIDEFKIAGQPIPKMRLTTKKNFNVTIIKLIQNERSETQEFLQREKKNYVNGQRKILSKEEILDIDESRYLIVQS